VKLSQIIFHNQKLFIQPQKEIFYASKEIVEPLINLTLELAPVFLLSARKIPPAGSNSSGTGTTVSAGSSISAEILAPETNDFTQINTVSAFLKSASST
jgi:hypothetical protein